MPPETQQSRQTQGQSTSKDEQSIVVRFSTFERGVPIQGRIAKTLRGSSIDQFNVMLEDVQGIWEDAAVDHLKTGSVPSHQDREVIGGIYWLLGEMREQLSDFLYLTDTGMTPESKTDPAAHEYNR